MIDPELTLTKEVCKYGSGSQCDGEDPTAWVKAQELPYGSAAVTWRLTATNSGNITLDNIHVAKDWTTQSAAADDAYVGNTDACEELDFGSLDPGYSRSLTCTTLIEKENTADQLSHPLAGTLTNYATLNATFHAPDDPNGQDLLLRFTGNPEDNPEDKDLHYVPSNQDSASVTEPTAGLTLTKWVCGKGTGCADPTEAELAELAQDQAAGGWVKQTTVTYNTDAQWLIVVTNTGATDLANVTLTREDLKAGGGGHGSPDLSENCAVGKVLGDLASGGSIFTTCTTPAITNSNSLDACDIEAEDDPANPALCAVINTAKAKGEFTVEVEHEASSTPTTVTVTVETTQDRAAVNTRQPSGPPPTTEPPTPPPTTEPPTPPPTTEPPTTETTTSPPLPSTSDNTPTTPTTIRTLPDTGAPAHLGQVSMGTLAAAFGLILLGIGLIVRYQKTPVPRRAIWT
ncbi:MAG: hypothetical protein LBR33_10955 [Propionibacteriaceae bacterium]|nr:hypothetical protein [Propionibacteriaceae bacterium]